MQIFVFVASSFGFLIFGFGSFLFRISNLGFRISFLVLAAKLTQQLVRRDKCGAGDFRRHAKRQ